MTYAEAKQKISGEIKGFQKLLPLFSDLRKKDNWIEFREENKNKIKFLFIGCKC